MLIPGQTPIRGETNLTGQANVTCVKTFRTRCGTRSLQRTRIAVIIAQVAFLIRYLQHTRGYICEDDVRKEYSKDFTKIKAKLSRIANLFHKSCKTALL